MTNLLVEFKDHIFPACRSVIKNCVNTCNSIFTKVRVSTILRQPPHLVDSHRALVSNGHTIIRSWHISDPLEEHNDQLIFWLIRFIGLIHWISTKYATIKERKTCFWGYACCEPWTAYRSTYLLLSVKNEYSCEVYQFV